MPKGWPSLAARPPTAAVIDPATRRRSTTAYCTISKHQAPHSARLELDAMPLPHREKKQELGSPRRGARRQPIPYFAKQFLKLIEGLPQVKQVTLELDGPEICTVIEAPWPDNEYRDPIYGAEGDLLRAYPELEIDFRVVNRTRNRTRDLGSEPPEGVIILLRR